MSRGRAILKCTTIIRDLLTITQHTNHNTQYITSINSL